jgi:hypothetical protein
VIRRGAGDPIANPPGILVGDADHAYAAPLPSCAEGLRPAERAADPAVDAA